MRNQGRYAAAATLVVMLFGLAPPRALATTLPVASIASVSVNEGSGTHSVQLTVRLSARVPRSAPATISWKTTPSTDSLSAATAGSDYVAASGTAKIAGGSSATIKITILGDNVPELNEQFYVDPTAATGATLGSIPRAAVVLKNDDTTTPTAAPSEPMRVKATTCTPPLGTKPWTGVYWTPPGGGAPISGITVTVKQLSTGAVSVQSLGASATSTSFAIAATPVTDFTATVAVSAANWPYPPVTVTPTTTSCIT